MISVKIIALGNEFGSDDGAALVACGRLEPRLEVVRPGRPGPALLDLLEPNELTVLVDVTKGAGDPGVLTCLPLQELAGKLGSQFLLSSHGLGPAEALLLGRALGRKLPVGFFVGIEGEDFRPGDVLSDSVAGNMDRFVTAIEEAVSRLSATGGTKKAAGEDKARGLWATGGTSDGKERRRTKHDAVGERGKARSA